MILDIASSRVFSRVKIKNNEHHVYNFVWTTMERMVALKMVYWTLHCRIFKELSWITHISIVIRCFSVLAIFCAGMFGSKVSSKQILLLALVRYVFIALITSTKMEQNYITCTGIWYRYGAVQAYHENIMRNHNIKP